MAAPPSSPSVQQGHACSRRSLFPVVLLVFSLFPVRSDDASRPSSANAADGLPPPPIHTSAAAASDLIRDISGGAGGTSTSSSPGGGPAGASALYDKLNRAGLGGGGGQTGGAGGAPASSVPARSREEILKSLSAGCGAQEKMVDLKLSIENMAAMTFSNETDPLFLAAEVYDAYEQVRSGLLMIFHHSARNRRWWLRSS